MTTGHPDAERLAEYLDRTLSDAERTDVESHLVVCETCRTVLITAAAVELPSTGATGGFWGFGRVLSFPRIAATAATIAAAAVLVLAVWTVGRNFRGDRPELRELVAAAAKDARRPVEGRLTGGFHYAPPPEVTRGANDREVALDVRIAAANIEKQAQDNAEDAPASQAAIGVARLMTGDVDGAIAALERAAGGETGTAAYQSDLAASYLARARRSGSQADFELALKAADRALGAHPQLLEARFNRALALDGLRRADEAAAAWQEYLKLDAGSGWAEEARARRAKG